VDGATVPSPASASPAADVKFEVREDMNTPPSVVASDGRAQITLSKPDPALSGIDLARQREFTWVEPNGKTEKGGLIMPTSGQKPYPLVVQVYEYTPDRFSPDGPERQIYSAQTLAVNGIASLVLSLPADENNLPDAQLLFKNRVEAAVAALGARPDIDASRVGIIGFSRAGYYIHHLITHASRLKISAAVMDDSFSGSYSTYLQTLAADEGGRGNWERAAGGTFWQEKQKWLAEGSLFNVDHSTTPALFATHYDFWNSLPDVMETLGAYKATKRPFEFLLFPHGNEHPLGLPRQREASIQASADWMLFWLKGILPNDAARAKSWSEMRERWKVQQAWEAEGHLAGSTPDATFAAKVGNPYE
jgi:dipeptidyl aminopeptidase/acylaminoacyl peptidase